MFAWIVWLINKLFLVKEIRSKEGELHFLRWRLFQIPFFRIYLHKICLPDYDIHMHTHPWSFISIMLKGKYYERSIYPPRFSIAMNNFYEAPCIIKHHRDDAHHIEQITGPVWTLVFAYGKYKDWGYRIKGPHPKGFVHFINHKSYRKLKK